MANTKLKHPKFSKKTVFIVVCLVVLAMAVFAFQARQNENIGGNPNTTVEDGTYVNLDPPTEQELSDTEKHKDDLLKQSEQSSNTSTGSKKVTPVITGANGQQINAFVPGVFEEGGSCKATLTKGTEVVTKTSAGFENVSYTSCTPIDVSGSLGSGSWSVIVSYSSSSASGQSESKTFTVD